MNQLLGEVRGRRSVGLCGLSLLLALFTAVAGPAQTVAESFEVGQRWEYRHEGPRPGDMEPNVIDGQRILHVMAVTDEPEGKQWVIEERFTHSRNVIGRLHVNQQQMLTRLEIQNKKGEVARLRYDPLIPYQTVDLAVGAKRTMETTLKMESVAFSLPGTITIERLDDETIATPAGQFASCRHYRTTTLSTVDIKIGKIPITEVREQWYHERVHGMVKEVYRRGAVKFLAWSRPAYTATSVLTAFDKEEVKTGSERAGAVEGNEPRGPAPAGPPSQSPARAGRGRMLFGVLGILAVGSFLWARRTGRRSPAP
jgi:hypothetical protein